MTLRLSVVSEHGIRLGAQSTKVFGVHGGSIGRSTDNEWILPDPDRYLSGKHARVDFRAGSYILVDTSSNGTYVNGSRVPLGKYHDYSLQDGDYVRLGEYEFLVSIDKSTDFPPEESAIVAYDGHAPSSAVGKSTANDLGADLDLGELLEPRADERPATPWHLMTRPLTPEPKAAPPPTAAPAHPFRAQAPALFDGDFDAGLAAFCRGAGIDPLAIASDARGTALQLAGQLLRESVLGLMDLNQSRHEFGNRFRMPISAEDDPESPLKFLRGVDETLIRLLTTRSARAGSVESIRANFRDLKAHNAASLSATHAALEDFLGRVAPQELEERFDRTARRGVFGAQNKAKYWDLYTQMFPGLTQRPADGFPHVFTEAFSKAYQAGLHKLLPLRPGAFATRRHASVEPDGKAVGDP